MTSTNFGRNRFDFFLKPSARKGSKSALEEEVSASIDSILVQSNCKPPRTDLDRIGQHLGVVSIRFVPLAKRGRLLRVPGGYGVEVHQELNPFERRFVVAHELAHIVVEGSSLGGSSPGHARSEGGVSLSYRLLEEICDFGAREILLPSRTLRSRLRGTDPDVALVKQLAGDAECSVKLAANRICELEVWQCRFIWWQKRSDDVVAVASVPEVSEDSLPILLDDKAHVLARAFSEAGAVRGPVTMSFFGRQDDYRVQAIAIDADSALMLIDHGT